MNREEFKNDLIIISLLLVTLLAFCLVCSRMDSPREYYTVNREYHINTGCPVFKGIGSVDYNTVVCSSDWLKLKGYHECSICSNPDEQYNN